MRPALSLQKLTTETFDGYLSERHHTVAPILMGCDYGHWASKDKLEGDFLDKGHDGVAAQSVGLVFFYTVLMWR